MGITLYQLWTGRFPYQLPGPGHPNGEFEAGFIGAQVSLSEVGYPDTMPPLLEAFIKVTSLFLSLRQATLGSVSCCKMLKPRLLCLLFPYTISDIRHEKKICSFLPTFMKAPNIDKRITEIGETLCLGAVAYFKIKIMDSLYTRAP